MNFKNEIIVIDNPEELSALVNKKRGLPSDYIPEDLVIVEVPMDIERLESRMLRKVASDALTELFKEAEMLGFKLYAASGYRSYITQVNLFKSYAEKHGEAEANRFSAKPGHSEHQTGLTMDVTSENVDFDLVEEFGETTEGKWLGENSHRFGFIIRYPKGTEEITGYLYEPWHLRFLGIELATNVYESDLTYDEYWEKYLH